MVRQLKTFITNLGFFELAVAAPSMKAALEAWGMGHNAFQRGFARQTDDPKIIAAATAQPGTVLRRPVGSKGAFQQDAELPEDLALSAPPPPKAQPKTGKKTSRPGKTHQPAANRAAIISFEKARAKRERERAREAHAAQREREKRRRAIDKVEAEIDQARQEHEAAMVEIEAERDKLERRAKLQEERWQARRERLQTARDRAGEG